jgi:hypothetical protein
MGFDFGKHKESIAKATSSVTTARRTTGTKVGDGIGRWDSGALCMIE